VPERLPVQERYPLREISIDTSLYDLTETYPELIPVLVGLGFAGVANPEMRQSHGKVMSIRKGCEAFGKDPKDIAKVLEKHGFSVKD
jgi:hypothetical protein